MIDDTIAPSLSGVPANVTVECDLPAAPTVTADDNCDGSWTVTSTDDTSVPGQVTRTWTAADSCGNSVSESQVITIEDTDD